MQRIAPERWRVVSPHLDEALDLPEAEREAWLARLRLRDPTLARDVEALLDERGLASREAFLEGGPPDPPFEATLAGQAFGAYTLVGLIGHGGMGSVWLARRSDGRFEGDAAVKLLNASLVGHAGEKRFRREGNFLARLADPHIARLLDAGVSPAGQPYLVLEYVEGEPIDAYCDERRLGVRDRLRLFLDVLEAVGHAHANLIVHRDIKPSNVLVDRSGHVKLVDFGIAKLLEGQGEDGAETALTREGGRALTPEFAAPEQLTGGAITTATDVFALGTLLYVLLTGQHPAGAARGSTAELVHAIVDTEPDRVSAVAPENRKRALVGDLDTIVAKALKKNPDERYASVTALADDVARYLARKPISARRDTVYYRTAKFVRRHSWGVAAAGAAVLLLAGLVAFYTFRLASERDRARLQADKATKVSELLTNLLMGADPFASHDTPERTVRSILDAGAERIDRELSGQPEVQVEMLNLLGLIYHRLDLDEKARALLEKALVTGRSSLGPENPLVAESLSELGVLLRERGDYAAAEKVLTESLAMRRRILGSEHKDVAVTLVELAAVYSDQGQNDRAEPLLEESLAIRRKVLGDRDHETAVSLNGLARLERQRGNLDGAEALFRQALSIFRATRGEDHPHVATLLNNLGLVAMDRGQYPEAEALFRQALAVDLRTVDPRHPGVAYKRINLSGALLLQGRIDEAEAAAREGLEITRTSFGGDHPRVADAEIVLGRIALARGRPAEALPPLRDALRIRQRTFPSGDWRIGETQSELGAAAMALGRYAEAEGWLRDAERALRDVPGAQAREARANRDRLAALDAARGRPPARASAGPAAAPK